MAGSGVFACMFCFRLCMIMIWIFRLAVTLKILKTSYEECSVAKYLTVSIEPPTVVRTIRRDRLALTLS